MTEVLSVLANVSMLVFVVSSMLAMGLSLAIRQIAAPMRNVSAVMVVAAGNFADPNVLVMILVGSLLMLVILMPLGGELGKRQAAADPAAKTAGEAIS